ncbi:MAG: choice-of-anchor E domain-containing protein [Planctomycetota bacterium]
MNLHHQWPMRAAGIALALFTLLPALEAAPGTETLLFEQTVPLAATDWDEPVTFPRFDPNLGTLTDVLVTLDVVVNGSLLLENLGPAQESITGSYNADVILRNPDTSQLARVDFDTLIQETLAPFDGSVDFGGASGRTLMNLGGSDFDIVDLVTQQFGPFVGPAGNAGTVTLPFTATAFTTVSVFPNMTKSFGSEASAIVRLEYEYQPPALVDTLVVQASAPSQALPWGGTIDVPRFDPSLGNLLAIEFELTGNFDGAAQIENLGPSTVFVDTNLSASMFLQRPGGGGLIVQVNRNFSQNDTLPPFDGTVDFVGPSGRTYAGGSQRNTQIVVSPPPPGDLALFTGISGAPGLIQLPISSTGSATVTGSANISVQSNQSSSADLMVTYVFEPNSRLFCFGNGGLVTGCTPCPCNNNAPAASLSGCMNSSGQAARLRSFGQARVSADTLRFTLQGANPSTFALLVSGNNQLPNPGACPAGAGIQAVALDGLRCVGGGILRHGVRATNLAGSTISPWGPPGTPTNGLIANNSFIAGQTRYFQAFYREDAGSGCGRGQNTSNGVIVDILP